MTAELIRGVRLLVEPQEGCGFEAVLRCAQAAEELGFEGVFSSDHFVKVGAGGLGAGPLDAWMLLAAIAVQVPTIRVGSLVSPITFRNPVMLAVAAAQLDQLSGGRAELGVGAGWHEAEHRALGIDLSTTAERMDRLDDALSLIRAAWGYNWRGSELSFAGRRLNSNGWHGGPAPVQQAGPPIIVGGTGRRRTPVIAARHADEYNVPFQTARQAQVAFRRLDEACEKVHRREPIRRSAAVAVFAGDSEAAARTRAEGAGEDLDELTEYGGYGTVERIAEILDDYWTVGADRIYLQLVDPGDLAHLELLATAGRAASAPRGG